MPDTSQWPDGADHSAALPKRLAPTSAATFKQCPRKFYYSKICGFSSPPTLATAKGNVAHAAFERMFDHPPAERTPEVAVSYVSKAWAALCDPQSGAGRGEDDARAHAVLAPAGSAEEAEILADAETFVRNWFSMERVEVIDPTAVVLPDGSTVDGRELHMSAKVAGVPLHGFVDRLDSWVDGDGVRWWSITDYKTGKVPSPRFVDDYWFQLRVYALLARRLWQVRLPVLCRLVFVKSGKPEHVLTRWVGQQEVAAVSTQVGALWRDIRAAARSGTWPTRTGPLCGWCNFQDVCPAFHPELAGMAVSQ